MFADEKSDATVFTLFGSTITVILLVTPCDLRKSYSFPALLQRFFLLMKPLQPMFLLTYMSTFRNLTPLSESLKMKSRDLLIHNNRLPAERYILFNFTKRLRGFFIMVDIPMRSSAPVTRQTVLSINERKVEGVKNNTNHHFDQPHVISGSIKRIHTGVKTFTSTGTYGAKRSENTAGEFRKAHFHKGMSWMECQKSCL